MKENDEVQYPGTEIPYFNFGVQLIMALAISVVTLGPYRNGLIRTFFSRWFYYPFLTVFGISMFVVVLVHGATIWLDKSYRWEEKFLKRLLYQLLLGWIVPVVLSILCTWVYFKFLGIDIMNTLYSRYKLPLVLALCLILDAAYMCYYLDWYFRSRLKRPQNVNSGQYYPDNLIFSQNGGEIKIKVSDIAYLCGHGKNTAIQFHESAPVILGLVSLEEIMSKLNPDHFCKVNRSYIITRKAYSGYKMRKNRGILLLLKPEVKEEVKVSRTNANTVLSWLKQEPYITN